MALVAATAANAAATTITKTIVVTGASRGIGLELCRVLLRDHPNVHVVLGSRSAKRGQQVADELIEQFDCKDRLDVVELDTSSEESVQKAARDIEAAHPEKLYGIVNNAGIAYGHPNEEIMNTNYWGPRRVNDAFTKLLRRPGGRIVNIASASGPSWLATVTDKSLKSKLAFPWTIPGGVEELDEMARTIKLTRQTYGISKAFLNAYTTLHAQAEPDLIINSVTPGFIATDMGVALGATNPVEMGVKSPLFALLNEELEKTPTGRYYGSDCKRSPVDVYRGPGDPVFVGPDWIDSVSSK